MASLWGPTDSPPKFIPAQACSLDHNHRHNKFKGSFIWQQTLFNTSFAWHKRESTPLTWQNCRAFWWLILGTHTYFAVWKIPILRRKTSSTDRLNYLLARSTAMYFDHFSSGLSSIHTVSGAKLTALKCQPEHHNSSSNGEDCKKALKAAKFTGHEQDHAFFYSFKTQQRSLYARLSILKGVLW